MLSSWGPEVAACQLIFYRAVGPFNRSVLFGGKSSPLNKGDARLRPVPFPTRRATFSEVQRVHSLLATVTVYGELTVTTSPWSKGDSCLCSLSFPICCVLSIEVR